MAFEDKTLVCKDCGKEFIFSAGEQEFYAEKGFENSIMKPPARFERQLWSASDIARPAAPNIVIIDDIGTFMTVSTIIMRFR